MVEQSINLDALFQALSDGTRRDILHRVAKEPVSISDLASPYQMSFAAVAKHVSVLEKAALITKERNGKEQMIIIVPKTLGVAQEHIERYAKLWGDRFNKLEQLLNN